MNNIKIPDNLDEFIEGCVDKVYKEEKSKKRRIASVTVASFLALFTLFGISNPAVAAKLPIIGSIFEIFDNNNDTDFGENSKVVGRTTEDKGYKVTMSQIATDEKTLYVEYTIVNNKGFENIKENEFVEFLESSDLKVVCNGEEKILDGYTTIEGYFKDKNTFVGYGQYSLERTGLKVGDNAIFKAEFIAMPKGYIEDRDGSNMVQGTWDLQAEFKVEKPELKELEVKGKATEGFSILSIKESPFRIYVDLVTNKDYRPEEKVQGQQQVKAGEITDSFWLNFMDQNENWINPVVDHKYIKGDNGELIVRYTLDKTHIGKDIKDIKILIEDKILAVAHNCEEHEDDPYCNKVDLEPQKKFIMDQKIELSN